MTAAESASESYIFDANNTNLTYYNSKYSIVINDEGDTHIPELPESIQEDAGMYMNISVTPNSHFHDIPVNVSHSSVHVPTNVYDRSKSNKLDGFQQKMRQ